MEKIKGPIYLLIILLFLFVLSACSSGGGGGSKGSTTQTNTTVSGSAVKGIIKNAIVEVFAIESGGVAIQPVATTTTDINGHYTFTLDPDFSGPVLVTLRDNGDQANPSTITCDVQPGCGTILFGGDMPLGNLVLKTVVASVTGGSAQTAAVTPFTHMAAIYAEQLPGGLTADNIATANSKLGNMLGVNNIVTTIPPDITSATATGSFNELKYAYLSAAIASLAEQSYSGDIPAVLDVLVDTYTNNGGELISSESMDSSSILSLEELASHAQMQAFYNDADGQVQNALESLEWIAQNAVDQPTTTMPSPSVGLGDVELVKDFVADVRTWGNVIDDEVQNYNGDFQQKLDMAEVTFDLAGPLLTDAFDHGMTAAFEAYINGTDMDLSTYFSPTDPIDPVTAVGTITVTDNMTNTTIVLDGTINGIDTSFTLEAPLLDNSGNLIGTNFDFAIANVLVQDSTAAVSAASGTATISYPELTDLTPWLDGTLSGGFPDPESGTFNLINVAITEIDTADPISFSGDLAGTIIASRGTEGSTTALRDAFGNVIQYNPANFSFTGELTNSTNTNSISGHIAASMPNAETFMPIGPKEGDISVGIASYVFSNGGNTLTITLPDFVRSFTYDTTTQLVTITETYTLFGGTWDTTPITTYATFSDYLISSDYWISEFYTWIDGEGEYQVLPPVTWNPAGGTMDGTLLWRDNVPDEDVNNFRQLSDVTINFTAQLEGLPQALFTVSGDRTGFESGSAMMTISYGGRRIEVNADAVNGQGTGTIEITNQDGVAITIERNDTNTDGVVMYNGTKYADIEDVNGVTIIRYTDGFFDSL